MSITVGYSTRNHNPSFIEYLRKSSGFKKIEVVEKVNNGEKSLSQIYNEILNESKTDIVVLCHDDIYFDTPSWYHKIIKHFDKSDYGILGVAGTSKMPKSGKWWEDRKKMYGIVNHEHNGKKWESKYSQSIGNNIKEVVVVDGLFLVIDKTKLKKPFDESVQGFHFYDIQFCFNNFLEGVKIGVIFNIRITHKSIGETNQQWEINRQIFEKKYENFLPVCLKKTENDKCKILYCPSQKEQDFEKTKSVIDFLKKNNFELEILLDETKPIKKIYDYSVNKKYLLSNPPGYKFGDGKWSLNQNGALELSKPGVMYNVYDPNYDLIILGCNKIITEISELYPSVNKVIQSELSISNSHHSIKDTFVSIENYGVSKLIDIINVSENPTIKKNKIKIVSGHSEKGGSTTSFIRLTNQLNQEGFDVTFYGPHSWHIDKCKSGFLKEVVFEKDDIVIIHFLSLPQRPNVKKIILGLHEKNLFEISKMNTFWDKVVFLNEEHRKYHKDYLGSFDIIPNLQEELIHRDKKPLNNVAAVVGTIDQNKQTHISIERALSDNCDKVYIFGTISDKNYFEKYVSPLLSEKVIHLGYMENKQQMYDMVGRVYLSSKSEVAPLVAEECNSTGTLFFGNSVTNFHEKKFNNQQIIDKWKQILQN